MKHIKFKYLTDITNKYSVTSQWIQKIDSFEHCTVMMNKEVLGKWNIQIKR